MKNDQMFATELVPGKLATAPLLLLELMRDLAVLEEELRTIEDAMDRSISRYQDPLAERLRRVGVSDQKVEDFIAWRRTISNLIADGGSDEKKRRRSPRPNPPAWRCLRKSSLR